MKDEIQRYISLPYAIEVVPEHCSDGSLCYLARHPELPGCMSHGIDPDEAIANLYEAKKLYIETLLEKSQEIPLPQNVYTGACYQNIIWRVFDTSQVKEKKILPEIALSSI